MIFLHGKANRIKYLKRQTYLVKDATGKIVAELRPVGGPDGPVTSEGNLCEDPNDLDTDIKEAFHCINKTSSGIGDSDFSSDLAPEIDRPRNKLFRDQCAQNPSNNCAKDALLNPTKPREEKKPLMCDICAKILLDKKKLENHIVTVHGGCDARFACYQNGCGYQTNCKTSFRNHVKSVHDKVLDLACDKCPYRTSKSGNLKRHMNCHTKASERTFYGCLQCDFAGTQKESLQRHMESRHNATLTGKPKHIFPTSQSGRKQKCSQLPPPFYSLVYPTLFHKL